MVDSSAMQDRRKKRNAMSTKLSEHLTPIYYAYFFVLSYIREQ